MRRPALALAAREAFPDGVSQPVGAWADGILILESRLALGTFPDYSCPAFYCSTFVAVKRCRFSSK